MNLGAKGSKTQQDLLEGAISLIYKNGFNVVSMQMVADKLSMKQASLYRYFKNKEDLLAECAIYITNSGRKMIDENITHDLSTDDQLIKYIYNNFKWAEQYPSHCYCLHVAFINAKNNRRLKVLHDEIIKTSIERIEKYIIQGHSQKLWQINKHYEFSQFIHNVIYGEVIKIIYWKLSAEKQFKDTILILNRIINNK